jgi:hypothetical protein
MNETAIDTRKEVTDELRSAIDHEPDDKLVDFGMLMRKLRQLSYERGFQAGLEAARNEK